MFKKVTYAVTISALAALSLVSIASADGNEYADFTIANGDPNEEGNGGQVKVQPALVVERSKLNIGAGDDSDKPSVSVSTVKLNVGAGDDNDKPSGPGERPLLNIGASAPHEQ